MSDNPANRKPAIPMAHVASAREMVNVHLQGRNPRNPRPFAPPKAKDQDQGKGAQSRTVPGTSFPSNATTASPKTSLKTAESSALSSTASAFPGHNHNHNHNHASVSVPARNFQGEAKNPQCGHCGTVIIPSPKATFPLSETPSITVNDWSIYTSKGPILSSNELDHLNETRFDFPLPEMIFGKNRVQIVNDKTGAVIDFNTLDALDSLAPHSDFKVAYYEEWLSTRPKAKDLEENREKNENQEHQESERESTPGTPSSELESVKPYDWTYSTNYKGTISNARFEPTDKQIPVEKLMRPDPILFFDESILFEDELGDNGISMLSTKIRVMHTCLLFLCRFSMRVDDVAFRVRDTRIFVDLETNEVLREYKQQQASYGDLLRKVSGRSDPKKLFRDSNWVSQHIPELSRETEVMVAGCTDCKSGKTEKTEK